jgi:hypothetical protein
MNWSSARKQVVSSPNQPEVGPLESARWHGGRTTGSEDRSLKPGIQLRSARPLHTGLAPRLSPTDGDLLSLVSSDVHRQLAQVFPGSDISSLRYFLAQISGENGNGAQVCPAPLNLLAACWSLELAEKINNYLNTCRIACQARLRPRGRSKVRLMRRSLRKDAGRGTKVGEQDCGLRLAKPNSAKRCITASDSSGATSQGADSSPQAKRPR